MKSEELLRLDSEEDNRKAVGLLHTRRSLREERSKKFIEWIPAFKEKCISFEYNDKQYCYIIEHSRYGIIKFFPKANKVFLLRKEKWIKPGLRWLVQNILQKDLA